MTYRWDGFHGRALYELNGLPSEVRDGPLLERLLDLLKTPWDAVPERPGQTAIRHAFFGESGEGMPTLLVDDDAETLRIIDILWMG
ncbi:hypothetical protein Acsp03_22220 [Actinomadura sp. NBRC 104412]|uniref:hypothetical protein n=1 Tax=Actinomadura sp. NBRC 104412 TaxID=3032203 RepID=UPI0024A2CD02|nr:hypothetical protein [Actinomadura sp. NBRC 104412]GLZ04756.1 hypothetical protein Acsp03_22220 [Actinomadura sp. NBRC 104412]